MRGEYLSCIVLLHDIMTHQALRWACYRALFQPHKGGESMATFVLVHGSWHDEHAWKPVISYLESQGHTAFAPTMAGHGKGVNKHVNHAQCTQSVVDYVVGRDLTKVILLGHSF